MKTKAVKAVSAIFILLLACPVLTQPGKRSLDGGDENERLLKRIKIEESSDVSISSDDDLEDETGKSTDTSGEGDDVSFACWDEETLEKIKEIQKANPNFSFATALLFVGAQADDRDALKFIEEAIKDGADVNAIDSEGMTALMYTAGGGNTDVVSLLLEHGADLNMVDARGNSLLIIVMTADFAQVSTAQFLLNIGCTFGDKEIQTAFDVAEQYVGREDDDYAAMHSEWLEFAHSLLITQVGGQMTVFAQVNLPKNMPLQHALPQEVLNLIGNFMVGASLHH